MFRRRPEQRSDDSKTPLAVSTLDTGPRAPLETPLPGHRVASLRLPDIVMPSTSARLMAETSRAKRIVAMYSTILGDRDNTPLCVGVDRRAAVLLRLTGAQRVDLDQFDEGLRAHGATLHIRGEELGRHGMVRVVLGLPDTQPGRFEATLSLADGDVQEFFAAAYDNDNIEVHVFHASDDRMVSATCSGPELRRVIREALQAILALEHPATAADQEEPAAELAERYPEATDGLDEQAGVRLRVVRPAQPFVLFAAR